jgi:Leucine-rich repeat (LRR) protein
LNENLRQLRIKNNKLTALPELNSRLKVLSISGNPVREILHIENKNLAVIKIQIQKINKFREFYYSQKYKNQFRYLLWEKIREPKIIQKYHPDYLIQNLHEDTDLDEFLKNW